MTNINNEHDYFETIGEYLLRHAEREQASFHMPGHKGRVLSSEFLLGGLNPSNIDITEVEGADNLFQAEGIIRGCMNRYKTMYGVRESFLLVNGSTSGIMAAILYAVNPGEKLILASNCHKSAINGLTLAGGIPIYVNPESVDDSGVSGPVAIEEIKRAVSENPDAKAVFITSPNYYGVCSNIETISDITREAGMLLIVDQAHGAHLRLFENYNINIGDTRARSSEASGADVVINSIHKTLASYTQTAIVNICTEEIDLGQFEDYLQILETSSPSYLLMNSMDCNAALIENQGKALCESWKDDIETFHKEAKSIKGLKIIKSPWMDYTKINLDMSELGLNGFDLENELMADGIYVELVSGNIVMAMTGIGNRTADYQLLIKSLQRIADKYKNFAPTNSLSSHHESLIKLYEKGESSAIPRKKEKVKAFDSIGRVCAIAITPYPPGIPLIAPGQIIEKEQIEYAMTLKNIGFKVIGITEKGYVYCGE